MHSKVCDSLRVAVAMLSAFVLGCRGESGRQEPDRTIVVRNMTQAAPALTERRYDTGSRLSDRIEVVLTDPRGGDAGNGLPALAALTGRSVNVQFRRDLLGQSAAAPISPTARGPGGRAVHLAGTVRSAARGWLVIEDDEKTYWIPQAAILVIEVTDAPATAPSGE